MQIPGLPEQRPGDQVLASLWVFPAPGTVPLCGMSLDSVFNFFIDDHLGQTFQFQSTLQSAKIPKLSIVDSQNTINVY